MTEITQADRDAAASGYFAWCSGNPVIPERMKAGDADDHSMVQAFARHRVKTEQKIVAWLRKQGITEDEYQSKNGWWWTPTGAQYGASILEAIEAGEHLK